MWQKVATGKTKIDPCMLNYIRGIIIYKMYLFLTKNRKYKK